MTSTRAVAYIGGASLLLAWLASAAGVSRQPRAATPPSRPGDAVVVQIATDIQAQAARLRHRLATAPAPTGPMRNPFAFGSREPAMAPAARRVGVPQPVLMESPSVPAAPLPMLLGIAEQTTPAGQVRTAMFSSPDDELIMAIEGETVGRFRLTAVGADAVELQDTGTGQTHRLVLR